MKTLLQLSFLLLISSSVSAQLIVDHVAIQVTNMDVTTSTTVGQITINPTASGKVIVHFDGVCLSTAGDRIILAASNTVNWSANDGNVGVEAYDADQNSNSFSHTRVYDVTAGSQTFYAVAHNFVETDGNGMASIYGNLSVEFVPSSDGIVMHDGITSGSINLTNETIVSQLTIAPTVDGKVIVRFDGVCGTLSGGGFIVLAASDNGSWGVNDGNVAIESLDFDIRFISFSHTRVYDIAAGSHTYYAVAQNYDATAGTTGAIYGSLTVQFIPDEGVIVAQTGVSSSNTNVASTTTLGQVSIDPLVDGKVIVSFDGFCYASDGDRIVLAGSDDTSWSPNAGSVSVEAIPGLSNGRTFSHSRVYDVSAGNHTFYAVAQNYVETAGNGIISVFGSLTVKFVPNPSVVGVTGFNTTQVNLYPNPTSGMVFVQTTTNKDTRLVLIDALGRTVAVKKNSNSQSTFDLSDFENGVFHIQLIDATNGNLLSDRKVVKVAE